MDDDTKTRQLVRAVYLTEDEEIDCSTCLDLVAGYVDRELDGDHPERDMPELVQHLAVCRECHEEYEALRDLAGLERPGGLPARDDLLRQLRARPGDD